MKLDAIPQVDTALSRIEKEYATFWDKHRTDVADLNHLMGILKDATVIEEINRDVTRSNGFIRDLIGLLKQYEAKLEAIRKLTNSTNL